MTRAPAVTTILTIGRFRWDLGLEYAVCAVAEARRLGADVRYDLVGSGAERDRVLFTASDVGAEDVVSLRPLGSDVGAYLERADVFLWPHLVGGLSAAADAAAHCGIPIVTTVPSLSEVRSVPVRNIGALAVALVEAARAPRSVSRRAPTAAMIIDVLSEAPCGSR
jgi:glycosyltransferase involved in cell wall biosynthesis